MIPRGTPTIAVLSDLHIGDGCRAKDLCPHDKPKLEKIEADYRTRFLEFIDEQELAADYLVVAGDLASEAHPDEYALAGEFLTDIVAALGVPDGQAIMAPGNHDVDWAVLKLRKDKAGVRWGQRYDPLTKSHDLVAAMVDGTKSTQDPFVSLREFDDAVFVSVNSAATDDPDLALHKGIITESSLQELDKALKGLSAPGSDGRLRALVVHHHPLEYGEPVVDDHDPSAMTNAVRLVDLLNKYRFDLLIHGHKHVPQFRTMRLDSGFTLVILGSGSFSAILDKRWDRRVANQFHLVHVRDRDVDTQYATGAIESWAYNFADKWHPSEEDEGILHVHGFGKYVERAEILERLKPIIVGLLEEDSSFTWNRLVAEDPTLEHVHAGSVFEILSELEDELGFWIHGNDARGSVYVKGSRP